VETNIIECIFYSMPKEGFRHSEESKEKQRLASTGRKLSKEARKKISESNRRRKVSDETRRKQSRRMKEFYASGGQNLTKGRKHSEETRRKLSKLAKKRLADPTKHPMYGRKHSAESRRRNSEAQKKLHAGGYQSPFKGKKHSASSIKKMRESHKGAKAWNKGKQHSEETRQKIREARARQVTTNETKRKMSRSQKKRVSRPEYVSPRQGKKDSAETKKLKSDIVKERYKDKTKHPFYGKKHKRGTRKKMRVARSTAVFPRIDTKIEKILQELCDSAGIKYQKHKSFNLGFQYHQTDLFIEPNICIEADGVYWHAHPKYYKPDVIIHRAHKNKKQMTAKDVRARDRKITRTMEKQGLIVLRFWADEIKETPEKCLQKIKKAIKN